MAFPDTPLDPLLEILVDGEWSRVPTYNRDRVTVQTGRGERATVTDPGSLEITINNRDGRYSPRNAQSDLYGKIGRNTRCRLSVAGTESYLELDGTTVGTASTPDTAVLDITGDIDLRWDGEADWYAPSAQMLLGKWQEPGNRSYHMRLENGSLWVVATTNGTTGHVAGRPLPAMPRRAAVRITIDVNDGAGNSVFRHYWAPSLEGPWTQIGDDFALPSLTIFPVAAPLQISPRQVDEFGTRLPVAGRCYRAEVRAGIDGTVVASPDFTAQAANATGFTDPAGRPWTVAAGAIRDRADLFAGEISEWPQEWTPDGSDAWVPIKASGILRRMGQGKKALESTLRRRIPSYSPLAYWPMEEGADATHAYSPLKQVPRLRLTNADWAAADSLPSSKPLPTLNGKAGDLARMTASFPNPSFASLPGWSVQWVYRLDEPNTTLYTFMRILSLGTVQQWYIQSRDNLSRLIARDPDDGIVVSQEIGTRNDLYGQWVQVSLSVTQEGSNVRWRLDWRDVGGDVGGFGSTFPGTAGRPTGVGGPPDGFAEALNGMAIGHIAVFDVAASPAFQRAVDAWTGETAWARMRRLADEESLHLARIPGALVPQQVGPQTVDTLLNLLQAAADADGGMLLEDRRRPGLLFRERSSLYNQTPKMVLSYSGAPGLAAPLRPVDDDTAIRNDRTVKRDGGSEGRAVLEDGPLSVQDPPDGVGRYDDSITLSLHDDAQAEPIAHWRLHLGTHDGLRYPQIRVMLHKAPGLIPAALDLTEGDLVRITGLPKWAGRGDVDLLVEGIRHEATLTTWDLILTCSPGEPWRVGASNDEQVARVDTDHSQTSAAVDAGATILPVLVTDDRAWAGSPADLPYDVRVGGEVMTCTAVADAPDVAADTYTRAAPATVLDAFERTISNGWGSADTGQAWSNSGGSAADYSTSGGVGRMSVGVVNSSRFTTLAGISDADVDVRVDITVPVVATGASISTGLRLRSTDTNNYYYVETVRATNGTISVLLVSRVAAVSTTIASAAKGTYTAGQTWRLRARLVGTVLQAKLWKPADPEPADWDVQAVTSSITAGGPVGLRAILSTGNTNALPVVCSFDNFSMSTVPQGWGTSSTGQVWSRSGGAAADYTVTDGYGAIALTSVASSRRALLGPAMVDSDVRATWRVPIVAVTDSIDLGLVSRYLDGSNYYHAILHFHNDATMDLRIRKLVAGTYTTLFITGTISEYAPGDAFTVRMATIGNTLRARAWRAGNPEPAGWQAEVTDTDLTAAGRVGIRANLQENNTNALPVDVRADDFRILGHQLMTVTRSVNGVTKAHPAGSQVRLAHPSIVAL